ncbi:exodeoxyribonuclease V subunit alpha [Acinetobacter portensis]|uniref:exodeoxyribonuclease V subunit alpha n=1 Tax=Acinetobacter portensis TaxID=1839785 RepID=UPI0013D6C254|nr:exodeoxyribonuclease V subunit alpha [Acinetobacter portensis]
MIKQQPESHAVEWFQTWSDFLAKSPFNHAEKSENSTKIMQDVLEAASQGDSCIALNTDDLASLKDLVIHKDDVSSQNVAPFIHDDQYLYLYRYWVLENALCQQVTRLKNQKVSAISLNQYNDLLEDSHQKNALSMVATNGFSIITGGPGTGKTYTLARIIAVLNQEISDIRIAMAAPTGKAAQRMKEALQKSFEDEKLQNLLSKDLKRLTPITIHRLLGLGNGHLPRFHEKQPLPYDVIVIDEASMLDLSLAKMLFAAVPDQARLILLGDANQLASVDVGSVLADLQNVESLQSNFVNLVTSRRFKDGALIGEMAKFIQQSHDDQSAESILDAFHKAVVQPSHLIEIVLSKDMQDQVNLEYLPTELSNQSDLTAYYDKLMLGYASYVQALKQYLESDEPELLVNSIVQIFDDYRILTAIRHGTFGLTQINHQIEQRILSQLNSVKQGDWYVGRPVMMTYNDYQLGLSNGDIGICFNKMNDGKAQYNVYFPSLEKWVLATRLPKNIETAFALTIHKSQGSEFTHTAVVLDQAAQNLLSKELIYTAITRAKAAVSLLVDRQSFVQALTVKTSRKSGIQNKLNKV